MTISNSDVLVKIGELEATSSKCKTAVGRIRERCSSSVPVEDEPECFVSNFIYDLTVVKIGDGMGLHAEFSPNNWLVKLSGDDSIYSHHANREMSYIETMVKSAPGLGMYKDAYGGTHYTDTKGNRIHHSANGTVTYTGNGKVSIPGEGDHIEVGVGDDFIVYKGINLSAYSDQLLLNALLSIIKI